jgi:hypothetical protein
LGPTLKEKMCKEEIIKILKDQGFTINLKMQADEALNPSASPRIERSQAAGQLANKHCVNTLLILRVRPIKVGFTNEIRFPFRSKEM